MEYAFMINKHDTKSRFNKHAYRLLGLLFLFFAVTPSALAQRVTLTWEAFKPAPDIYRLFQRTSEQAYDYSKWIYEGSKTTCVIDNLTPGTSYHFVVRAYSGDDQSDDSNEVSYTASADNSTDPSGDQNSGNNSITVIDNSDSESVATGSWKTSGGKNPYGQNSLYSKDAGATYTFNSSLTGVIDVSLWWTEWSNRSASVPIRIYDGNNLLDTVYVDHKANGGKWNLLGRYAFSRSARVTVVSEGNSYSTCADAVKFSVAADDTKSIDDSSSEPNPDNDQDSGEDISMVIDNGDSKSFSRGTWKRSSGKNPFGNISLYSREAGATHTFESSLTGVLNVSLWWTEWKNRCNSVPIHIYDGDHFLDTVYVNQLKNGGQWNSLGKFSFDYSAEIVIESESSTCSTCADAVRIEQSR
jgi:hypothetical protein